ncbi:MAG TPA: hypothetical protein VK145_01860, partial [Candidatus Nanoarchaeia archaeon]|nr:hypothetical protein [Candidatus Nanoarchaeia archaeon]
MNNVRTILREHSWAIILAVLLSILVVAPQLVFRAEHKDVENRIELIPDSPWSPRVREIQDGYSFGNIYNKHGKDNPYLFQPLGSMIVAYMGSVFGLDINDTILLSRVVLPFVTFLILYWFVFLISKDRLVSLISASALLVADSVLSFSGIMYLLQGVSPDNFLRLARPVNPAMVYIFFFGFLALFWKFYENRKISFGVLSAIVLGLNFYNYFYTWTYLYAFWVFLIFIMALYKQWKAVLQISLVYVGGGIVAIPYFINMYRATHYPAFEEVGARLGTIFTHYPLFIGFSSLAALLVFFFLYPKEDKQKYFFGLALLLTPFLTMNQQIITGRIMQADHYHWFFHKPIAFIFVLIIFFTFLNKEKFIKYRTYVGVVALVACFGIGIFVQAHSYQYDRRDGGAIAENRQIYAPVMKWLNENATTGAMVFSNDEVSHLTVIYTPHNVLFHRAACCTTLSATDEQMFDTVSLFYRIRDIKKDDVAEIFEEEKDFISSQIHGIYYRKLYGQYHLVPDDEISKFTDKFVATLSIPT